jgi:protein-tyrosine phosphatase
LHLTWPRVVDWIDGALNLRDFGGYPTADGALVRTGLLYRSGTTHGISSAGLARLADELGVRTVIDLRAHSERSRWLSPFADHGIATVHEPLDPGAGIDPATPPVEMIRRMALGEFDWIGMYWSMLTLNGERFKRIFELLSQPGTLPVLVHCAGGRDRTGVTVALIQAALDVREQDIAADFALSSQLLAMSGPRPEFERVFAELTLPREEILRAMETLPETMLALFEQIRREHGSVQGLLRSLGVGDETLAAIRAATLLRRE